jgi:hypothetical protein
LPDAPDFADDADLRIQIGEICGSRPHS